MWDVFLDFLFPRHSLTGGEGEWITQDERRQLHSFPIFEDAAQLRSRGLQSLDRVVAGSSYHGCPLLKKAIHTFKYQRIPGLNRDLAELIVQVAPSDAGAAVLCPVPLHWTRQFQRGFNQAVLIAEHVSVATKLPVQSLLRRTRPTGHQAWRGRTERLDAVRDVFECVMPPAPARVILIDDLVTTGATLDNCAKALKDAGAVWVEGWVVGHS